jgi:hypothetical protein
MTLAMALALGSTSIGLDTGTVTLSKQALEVASPMAMRAEDEWPSLPTAREVLLCAEEIYSAYGVSAEMYFIRTLARSPVVPRYLIAEVSPNPDVQTIAPGAHPDLFLAFDQQSPPDCLDFGSQYASLIRVPSESASMFSVESYLWAALVAILCDSQHPVRWVGIVCDQCDVATVAEYRKAVVSQTLTEWLAQFGLPQLPAYDRLWFPSTEYAVAPRKDLALSLSCPTLRIDGLNAILSINVVRWVLVKGAYYELAKYQVHFENNTIKKLEVESGQRFPSTQHFLNWTRGSN